MNFPKQHEVDWFKNTNGAISVYEGCAIYWLASQCPEGCAVELGSHMGKAATMAAAGFKLTPKIRDFHLVDPCYDPKNLEAWKHSVQGSPDKAWTYIHDENFSDDVARRVKEMALLQVTTTPKDGIEDPEVAKEYAVNVILRGDYSLHAIPEIQEPIAYCMVDSNEHTYELCRDECNLLKNRMTIGGIIVFHDFFSQFHGVERAYREMLQGGMYEEIGIPWQEIIPKMKAMGGENGNASWHHREMETPCFLGAIKRVK